MLPVASFSDEGVKEVKGLDDSPYTSLQFLKLELESINAWETYDTGYIFG